MPTFVDVFLFRCQGSIPMIGRPLCLDVEKPSRIKPCRISFFLSLEYNHFYVLFQLQLSPSRSAAEHMNGNDTRSCVQDEDEMEMTDFYVGGGSQSVDCEASPPSLQVVHYEQLQLFLSKSNFFVLPVNSSYGGIPGRGSEIHQQQDMADSPRRLTNVQNVRGPNPRGSPHPYRANRNDGGQGPRSRCHTPDNLLNASDSSAAVNSSASYSRPQSIHDVPSATSASG